MTSIDKKFGKRLQEARKMRKLTQSALAELVGVEDVTISRIENGTHFPKKENIETLAKVLKIEVKELFDFGNFKTKPELIKDINEILENSTLKEIQCYKKIICTCIESKK